METGTDTVPPKSAACGGDDDRSISEIISNLRLSFHSSDFNRAEAELVEREDALRREITRLRKEKQSELEKRELCRIAMAELKDELAAALASGGGGADLEAERERAIVAEERLAKAMEHMAAEEEEKKSLAAEVSELRTRARKAEEKAEEYQRRVTSLEIDVFELSKSDNALRNSGVKSSPKEPIEILDSDNACSTLGKSSHKESSSPTVPKRKRSLSVDVSGDKNEPLAGGPTIANGNIDQEPEVSLIKPFTSPAKHDSPVKKQASSSSNGSEQPNAVPKQTPPVSDQADEGSGAKKFSTAHDYKHFWSRFGEIRRAIGSSPSNGNK